MLNMNSLPITGQNIVRCSSNNLIVFSIEHDSDNVHFYFYQIRLSCFYLLHGKGFNIEKLSMNTENDNYAR